MKTLCLLALITALAMAQTPPPKAAPKSVPAKSAAARKASPARSSARLLNPAVWRQQAPPEFKAKFTTTKGDFVIDVHRSWAPLGADRFYNLVRSGFFTDVSFYRVV